LVAWPHLPIRVEAGDAAVRPLTPEERGDLFERAMSPNWIQKPTAFPVPLQLFNAENVAAMVYTAFLTVRTRQPKRPSDDRATYRLDRLARVVLALQLMDYDIMGEGVAISWAEPGPRLGVFGLKRVAMPVLSTGGSRTFAPLGPVELQRAVELAELIPRGCLDNPLQRRDIALHRFSLATSQREDAEAVIDYVIALEALLVPGESTTDTTLRFSLNGARFLATNPAERHSIYGDLKRLYAARSNLVHGTKLKAAADFSTLRREARTLASRGLVKALQSHWPTAEEFDSAALT
jgi:hypothetical protein